MSPMTHSTRRTRRLYAGRLALAACAILSGCLAALGCDLQHTKLTYELVEMPALGGTLLISLEATPDHLSPEGTVRYGAPYALRFAHDIGRQFEHTLVQAEEIRLVAPSGRAFLLPSAETTSSMRSRSGRRRGGGSDVFALAQGEDLASLPHQDYLLKAQITVCSGAERMSCKSERVEARLIASTEEWRSSSVVDALWGI